MSNKIRLSVIIPAYNEEKRIAKTLVDVGGYLSKQSYGYEIIVVSDGSRDKTADVVRKLMPKIKALKLIDNKENNGKGFVVRQGMLKAQGNYRLFMDADNSTPVKEVEKIWPYFEKGFEVVIGSREVEGAILDPPQPWLRKKTGAAFRLLTNIFTGLWEIRDTQCGFKGFTKKAVKNIFPKCRINRFAFDPEMLVIAKKLGYKIKEIPIYWRNDPESKVKFKNMVKMGIDLMKVRRNLIRRIYG